MIPVSPLGWNEACYWWRARATLTTGSRIGNFSILTNKGPKIVGVGVSRSGDITVRVLYSYRNLSLSTFEKRYRPQAVFAIDQVTDQAWEKHKDESK